MKLIITILFLFYWLSLINCDSINKVEKYGLEYGLYFSSKLESDIIYNVKKVDNYGVDYGLYFSKNEDDQIYNSKMNQEKNYVNLGKEVDNHGVKHGWFFFKDEYAYNTNNNYNGGNFCKN